MLFHDYCLNCDDRVLFCHRNCSKYKKSKFIDEVLKNIKKKQKFKESLGFSFKVREGRFI